VPDEIAWSETSDAGVEKDEINKKKLWEHFTDMSDKQATKPIMIYFFWPDEDEDSEDKKIANKVRRCKLMDKIFEDEVIRKVSVKFHCYKCNAKELSEELKKKYKITLVPKVLFFDVKGKKVWQLTSTRAKPKSIAKKMVAIIARCQKQLKKLKQ
jgi:hypothetical protein